MEKLKLKYLGISRVKKGYPKIVEQDLFRETYLEDGELVELTDEKGAYLATAYAGKENKAIGWVFTRKQGELLDKVFFDALFIKAREYRNTYFNDASTTAFRLFNGEGDGLGGFVADYYEGYAVLTWYNEGIYTYRQEVLESFQQAYPMIKGIYEKKRFISSAENTQSFISGERAPEPLLVSENGVKYAVYLDDGNMTGIFLDQRHVRRTLMEEYAPGKTVLNLFSYTGAFSVAATMGGAAKTISVDVANRSLDSTKENFEINGLDASNHEIRVMDVFSYIQYALRHQLTFDVIVSDPPTFARTKKRTFSVEKDYQELIKQYIDLTPEEGVLILSANTWALSKEDFRQMIEAAFFEKNQAFTFEEEFGIPEDFPVLRQYPEGDYLKVFIVRKKG